MQSAVALETDGCVLAVRLGDREVFVDASSHQLVVETETFGFIELGASSAGIAGAAGLVLDELGAESGERAVGDAIVACLRRAALRSEHGCPVDRFEKRDVRWSPLAYSQRFLDDPYLIDDVERFFACRVALAHVEDDEEESTPDAAETCVERLRDWRALYAFDAEAQRRVNATLAELGEDASAHALWGLRNVPLARRVKTAAHLEVLGALGRHPRARDLAVHMRIVENATDAELVDAFARIPRRALAVPAAMSNEHALAELIALATDLPPTAERLSRVVTVALEHVKGTFPRTRKAALPPVALPELRDVRFLATVGDILDEGIAMSHCVLTRARLAVDGAAFLFHVDIDGEPVTVQLDAFGHVVEARGFANRESVAAQQAAFLLERWGRTFRGAPPRDLTPQPRAIAVARYVHARAWRALTTGSVDMRSPREALRTAGNGLLSLVERARDR